MIKHSFVKKVRLNHVGPAVGVAGLAFLLIFVIGHEKYSGSFGGSMANAFGAYVSEKVEEKVSGLLFPVSVYEEKEKVWQQLAILPVDWMMPLYSFGWGKGEYLKEQPDTEVLLLGELQKNMDFSVSNDVQENSESIQTGGVQDLLAEMAAENGVSEIGSLEEKQQDMGFEDHTNAQTVVNSNTFIPRTAKLAKVDLASLSDYETLIQEFYTIDKSTMIGSDQLDVEKLTEVDMSISKETQGPQILIYHTHSQEAFADSVPGDSSTTIVGIGEYLARILMEDYGYQVLHHTGEYDVPSRDDAYSMALPEIEKLLEENPQIQVVIDLHRDAMDESTRLVTEVDGRPTARFMFFNGLSRTRKTGNISYLYNENLDNNLAFSFQLQKAAMEYYPGLTRKIYLKAYRYNMHLRPRNLLIELGAQNNTVEEAKNACLPLAYLLDLVLSGSE